MTPQKRLRIAIYASICYFLFGQPHPCSADNNPSQPPGNRGAGETEDRILALNCRTTPQVWSIRAKPPIYSTNNLRRRVGSGHMAAGQPIVIRGRILDSHCIPINQALVEIWHSDSRGVPHYKVSANYTGDSALYNSNESFASFSPEDLDLSEEVADPHFTGSGSCITDTLGYYTFHTIKPGVLFKGQVPKIMFRIKSKGGNEIETQMFFSASDAQIDQELAASALSSNLRRSLVATLEDSVTQMSISGNSESVSVYSFDVVLPEAIRYKQY